MPTPEGPDAAPTPDDIRFAHALDQSKGLRGLRADAVILDDAMTTADPATPTGQQLGQDQAACRKSLEAIGPDHFRKLHEGEWPAQGGFFSPEQIRAAEQGGGLPPLPEQPIAEKQPKPEYRPGRCGPGGCPPRSPSYGPTLADRTSIREVGPIRGKRPTMAEVDEIRGQVKRGEITDEAAAIAYGFALASPVAAKPAAAAIAYGFNPVDPDNVKLLAALRSEPVEAVGTHGKIPDAPEGDAPPRIPADVTLPELREHFAAYGTTSATDAFHSDPGPVADPGQPRPKPDPAEIEARLDAYQIANPTAAGAIVLAPATGHAWEEYRPKVGQYRKVLGGEHAGRIARVVALQPADVPPPGLPEACLCAFPAGFPVPILVKWLGEEAAGFDDAPADTPGPAPTPPKERKKRMLAGYKTYVAAIGLLGLGIYQISLGDIPTGLHSLFTAGAVAGLRSALATALLRMLTQATPDATTPAE